MRLPVSAASSCSMSTCVWAHFEPESFKVGGNTGRRPAASFIDHNYSSGLNSIHLDYLNNLYTNISAPWITHQTWPHLCIWRAYYSLFRIIPFPFLVFYNSVCVGTWLCCKSALVGLSDDQVCLGILVCTKGAGWSRVQKFAWQSGFLAANWAESSPQEFKTGFRRCCRITKLFLSLENLPIRSTVTSAGWNQRKCCQVQQQNLFPAGLTQRIISH